MSAYDKEYSNSLAPFLKREGTPLAPTTLPGPHAHFLGYLAVEVIPEINKASRSNKRQLERKAVSNSAFPLGQ